ncbi:MAG: GIY-YIG nuclease family protein [Alphaproteobacteria bacterium]|nr:GIY-YIG nuclease family protein [Alphaproteobacteria bacterium]
MAGEWVARSEPASIDVGKGAYVLALELVRRLNLDFSKFTGSTLEPGWYVYLGSARGPGGLAARLQRHFRADKKLHWHIDRLTTEAAQLGGLVVPGGHECALRETLQQRPEFELALPGFGSTDCRRCPSHLLRLRPC